MGVISGREIESQLVEALRVAHLRYEQRRHRARNGCRCGKAGLRSPQRPQAGSVSLKVPLWPADVGAGKAETTGSDFLQDPGVTTKRGFSHDPRRAHGGGLPAGD